jgi:hypothetical protein
MSDINDLARYLQNSTQKEEKIWVDDYLIYIQNHPSYQQICLFLSPDLQSIFQDSNRLKIFETLAIHQMIDSRFAWIYHPDYHWGLQSFFSLEKYSDLPQKKEQTHTAPQKPSKTSFSAQAKHLFLEMDNHSQTHSEQDDMFVQKPFSNHIVKNQVTQIPAIDSYETPCLNHIEALIFQADFIIAQLQSS